MVIKQRRGHHTFITGAQKCTVFRPTGLSHMRWNQLCCCCCCSAPPLPLPLLCHRRDHSWRRYTDRKGVARAKAWRVVAAAAEEWKTGRDAARAKLAAAAAVVGDIFVSFFFLWWWWWWWLFRSRDEEELRRGRMSDGEEGMEGDGDAKKRVESEIWDYG